MHDLESTVRKRIEILCREHGITINKLTTTCGITHSTIQNIMSGRNGATVSTIKKICDGLEMTLGEFFSTKEFDELEQEIK